MRGGLTRSHMMPDKGQGATFMALAVRILSLICGLASRNCRQSDGGPPAVLSQANAEIVTHLHREWLAGTRKVSPTTPGGHRERCGASPPDETRQAGDGSAHPPSLQCACCRD